MANGLLHLFVVAFNELFVIDFGIIDCGYDFDNFLVELVQGQVNPTQKADLHPVVNQVSRLPHRLTINKNSGC